MPFPKEQERELDFSKPLPLSDVVLVVEGQRFHFHRITLATWSPVFEQMFTSDFKEKTAEEVPLPEKEASQIKEMLLVIYQKSAKPIDENNCYFLLELAREYLMTKLTEKCEDFMFESLKRENTSSVLNQLIVSESYNLERLREECIRKTYDLSFEELKKHELYERVEPPSQQRITEGQIQKLEKEASMLRSQNEEMVRQAAQGLEHVRSITYVLAEHVRAANELKTSGIVFTDEQNMQAINNDEPPRPPPDPRTGVHVRAPQAIARPGKAGKCQYLAGVYSPLKRIQNTLENIQKQEVPFITANLLQDAYNYRLYNLVLTYIIFILIIVVCGLAGELSRRPK